MNLMSMTDNEIIELSKPMIDDVINASNEKNWDEFSKYQTEEELHDSSNRENVEKQWSEHVFLSSLVLERNVLDVFRRDDVAFIVWKQQSHKVAGDFLAIYSIKEIDGAIREVGFRIL